jgi:hypothetical protein
MKNRTNNVLPFPKPPEERGTSTIICQIGSERFAIHMQVENPAARTTTDADAEAKGEEGAFQGRENRRGEMTGEWKRNSRGFARRFGEGFAGWVDGANIKSVSGDRKRKRRRARWFGGAGGG